MGCAVAVQRAAGHIVVERVDGMDILRMAGEIDAESVAAYEALLPSADAAVIHAVDLAAVTYLSSSGIGLLLRQTRQARAQGKATVLRGASRQARRVLTLAGVVNLFHSSA